MPDRPRGRSSPVKAVATGPVISTWPSSRHSISSSPPSTMTRGAPAGQAAAVRVHQRRAGAGAAGQRQAGAALPDPQADAVGRQDLGEADIGALAGTADRAPASGRASAIGTRADVGDEERRVRIAHAGRRRIGERAGGEVQVQRVHRRGRAGCRASPAAPAPCRRAPGRRAAPRPAGRRRRCGSTWRRAAGLAHQQVGDAAGGVAAGAGLGAVGVADAHEGVGVAVRRRLDDDELVAADAGAPVGDRGGAGRREAERAGALVEHDEVVAAAVHLEEARHGVGICGGRPWGEGAGRLRNDAGSPCGFVRGSCRCRGIDRTVARAAGSENAYARR